HITRQTVQAGDIVEAVLTALITDSGADGPTGQFEVAKRHFTVEDQVEGLQRRFFVLTVAVVHSGIRHRLSVQVLRVSSHEWVEAGIGLCDVAVQAVLQSAEAEVRRQALVDLRSVSVGRITAPVVQVRNGEMSLEGLTVATNVGVGAQGSIGSELARQGALLTPGTPRRESHVFVEGDAIRVKDNQVAGVTIRNSVTVGVGCDQRIAIGVAGTVGVTGQLATDDRQLGNTATWVGGRAAVVG